MGAVSNPLAFAIEIFRHREFSATTSFFRRVPILPAKARDKRDPIFVFHTNEFWLNLHHFLYVLGRASNKERDTTREAVVGASEDQERGLKQLSTKEQQIWREAVASYAAGISKKDIVFDDPLPALTNALSRAGEAKSLSGSEIDPAISAILARAAPIYRKAWWSKHRDANRTWQKAIRALVDSHGTNVLAFITNAYMLQWPAAGFPVYAAAYSNWAGAYLVTGDILVVSSLPQAIKGYMVWKLFFTRGCINGTIRFSKSCGHRRLR
ncbi:MAG: hypothetical protein ACR2H4_03565 [Pyrinomonadaceae bacterium]